MSHPFRRMIDEPDPDAPQYDPGDLGVRRDHGGSRTWGWACRCGAWDEGSEDRQQARRSFHHHRQVCRPGIPREPARLEEHSPRVLAAVNSYGRPCGNCTAMERTELCRQHRQHAHTTPLRWWTQEELEEDRTR